MADDAIPSGATREQVLEVAERLTRGTMMERLGLEWVEIGPDRVVARMPVAGNTQPFGILHGGATAALCETVGSVGTTVRVGLDRRPVGLQLSVNHLRPVSDGYITATAVAAHVGRSTAVWDIRVEDDEGRAAAVGRLTVAIRDRPPPDARGDPG